MNTPYSLVTYADCMTSATMLGIHGEPPYKRGNCFSVRTSYGGEKHEYRIVNFNLENLEFLLSKGLTWPVRILVKSKTVALVYDTRIPYDFYQDHFCEVCCPNALLPEPQRLIKTLKAECGFEIHNGNSTSYDHSKLPSLENLK